MRDGLIDVKFAMGPGAAFFVGFDSSLSRSDLPENTRVNFSVANSVMRDDYLSTKEISAYISDRKGGTTFHSLPAAE